ncbi:FAD/NAD(P)-binding domain-containing protein [Purpureocillium lavendulum]|uniref:FAD/NAD(P)-binding domain-containing protein n=1 Tax=Purpureocillium lavendulum TaxID=1247861 RepID=A0AB34FGM3_9HYPO|nr:FAD/NAD(P)-binding domain-containing protein [Purpureocillium lavendulum]
MSSSWLELLFPFLRSLWRPGQKADQSPPLAAEARPFTIAIIGAGIGGLTLANGCLKNKVPFVLYEAAEEFGTVGAGVGLGPNAIKALELIDPTLRDKYNAISSGNLTPGKENVMFDNVYAEEGFGAKRGWKPAPYGAPCYDRTSAHRKDLLDILTAAIPKENVKFNKRVRSMKQGEYGVTIVFEDGEIAEASAVVGSDGVKGPTRGYVLGDKYPGEVDATYSGKYVYRAIAPMKDALEILGEHAGDAKAFCGHKITFITFPISSGTQYNLVAFKHSDTPWTHPQWTKLVTREEMTADFDGQVDQRLVKILDWAEPRQWSLHHHMNTPIYYNNLICLLGDSAHATTPHQASGAGQCIEDALVLSHVLGRVGDAKHLPLAFQVYDAVRRPRAQKVVRTSQEAGEMYAWLHPDMGDDMVKITENFNKRYLWIWEHDLINDLRVAESKLARLTGAKRM